MLRSMVFIDYQNFNYGLYYSFKGKPKVSVNFVALSREVNKILPFTSEVIKTYLFAYKPCNDLMLLDKEITYYNWLNRLKDTPYLDIIEGRQEIRYFPNKEFDLYDRSTYYTVEKETDINLATYLVSKGYQNAFDIAFVFTADSDYYQAVKTIHDIGKIVVLVHFPHQSIRRYKGVYDMEIILYDNIIQQSETKHN